MTLLGRNAKVTVQQIMDDLAAGKKPKTIAAEVGCSYGTLRARLARHVREAGFRTVEQAVAEHTYQQVKAALPAAVQFHLEAVYKRKSTPRA